MNYIQYNKKTDKVKAKVHCIDAKLVYEAHEIEVDADHWLFHTNYFSIEK